MLHLWAEGTRGPAEADQMVADAGYSKTQASLPTQCAAALTPISIAFPIAALVKRHALSCW